MAQNTFINITLDPNVASHPQRNHDNHGKALGAAASGDLTLSFDSAKFTSLSLLKATALAAVEQAAGMLKH